MITEERKERGGERKRKKTYDGYTCVMLHDLTKFDECANVALLIKKKEKKRIKESLNGRVKER